MIKKVNLLKLKMNLKKEQSDKYMKEAELTLLSAEAIFERAKEDDKDFWAVVVKNCYDSLEQAVSSAIASRSEPIPIKHPEKINKFTNIFNVPKYIDKKLLYWLQKRASTQYIDIKNNQLSVPHELFTEQDAEKALNDTREIINKIKELTC